MSLSIKAARFQSQGAGRVMPGIGDPGLFGFLGGIAKKAIGVVGRATGLIPQGPTIIQQPPLVSPVQGTQGISREAIIRRFQETRPVTPTPGVRGTIERLLPGGRTGFEVAGGAMGIAPSGFHMNKSDYFLKDGTFIPKGTRLVKNRRRNALNPRALDRAIGRVTSAKKASKKLGRITIRSSCPAKR